MGNIYRDLGKEFTVWFDWVLSEAEIYDYGRYPAKGMGVWLPYGFKLRKHVLSLMRELLDSTGHEEILLPLLIPETILAKESEHVRGFEAQVYWVTHGGLEPLDVKLALRPTSETSLTYMESLWIKSYKQLPKKYYQVVSIFRYETSATRAMLRVREVSMFKEAHTVHADFSDSERQVKEALEIYRRFFDQLGIPYMVSKRPEWDKFAGAIYTIAFDTLMPDGRVLQIGTVHNLGQNFTKAFEVRIQKKDQSIDYAWQTSYGISERVIATLLGVHGDKKGLVLPFNVAPVQIVIIPIPAGNAEMKERVVRQASELERLLKEVGFRAQADLREDITPGEKFNVWDLKGAPLRLDLGPREVQGGYVTLYRRDTGQKMRVSVDELPEKITQVGREVNDTLRERAWKAFKSRILRTEDLEEAKNHLVEGGVVEIPWCGKPACAERVAEILGAEALGTPLDEEVDAGSELKCPICGGRAYTYMRYARKY
ncbi:MAG: proline--tRNA ligase [Desulfurococcales archaeon]|nr:proline--tRNA ligase [Desulfurococcales archaeon]